jgi:hypothetical protein
MTERSAQAAQAAIDLVHADPRQARARATQALKLARRERDRAAMSTAHRALGLAAHELGDLDAALTALHAAVKVADSASLGTPAAQARMSRAFVLLTLGRTRAALQDADAAVASMQGLDRARALAQQGLILTRAGRLDHALDAYAAALPALRRHGDRLWEARVRNNRAMLHAYRGHHGRARADIMRAEELELAAERMLARAGNRWNLGVIEGMHGHIPAALTALDFAAEEFRKRAWPMAALLMDKGEVLLAAGLSGEALTTVIAAVAELSRKRQGADLAEARLLLARAQLAAGAPGPARDSAAAARRSFSRQHRSAWAAAARYVEVHAAWEAGDGSAATLRSAQKAALEMEAVTWSPAALDLRLLTARIATSLGRLDLAKAELRAAGRARGSAQLERQARAWHALALLRAQAGERRGAYAAVAAGLRAAERVRLLLGATELRVMVASHVAELAALGVSLAIGDRSPERALWSAERYRAATMRIRPVLPAADEELAALRAQLRAATDEAERARLSGIHAPALSRRQHGLEDRLRQRLRHQRGELDGAVAADMPGAPAGLAERLVSALPGQVLVEYVESSGTLFALVVGAGTRRPVLRELGPVESVAAELHALRFAWRRLLAGHGSAVSLEAAAGLAAHAAARLDQILLSSLASLIGASPLVVVPTGPLQSLPWPILPACAGRPVTVAPSATSWLAGSRGRKAGAARRVTLIAGPGLSEAAAEVRSIAALYPGALVLTGQDATVTASLRALDGADVAHLAAHGRFRADNPMFSSLVLADGSLTVYDLERLRRAPTTIMLAACDSALSPTQAGDEMTGLATGLLTAGARTVIAPVLPVPDDVSARLSLGLHRYLRDGRDPASALAALLADNATAGEPLARLAASTMVCLGHSQ